MSIPNFVVDSLNKKPAKILTISNVNRAAVSICLRYRKGQIEVLFMQRAVQQYDNWSGQVCFPGGRYEESDVSSRATAERETFEEVGINLSFVKFLGRCDDALTPTVASSINSINKKIHIAVYAYYLDNKITTQLNYEVASTMWIPATELADANNFREFPHPSIEGQLMAGIVLNKTHQTQEAILWGVSLRILTRLFDKLGLQLAATL